MITTKIAIVSAMLLVCCVLCAWDGLISQGCQEGVQVSPIFPYKVVFPGSVGNTVWNRYFCND